jgi:hypothetical protein
VTRREHAFQTYPSIEDFYSARGGASSGERDFGVMWLESGGGAFWPRHRVSVVRDTGDVYAISLERGGAVELIANVGPVDAYARAEQLLWAELSKNELGWARERLAGAA